MPWAGGKTPESRNIAALAINIQRGNWQICGYPSSVPMASHHESSTEQWTMESRQCLNHSCQWCHKPHLHSDLGRSYHSPCLSDILASLLHNNWAHDLLHTIPSDMLQACTSTPYLPASLLSFLRPSGTLCTHSESSRQTGHSQKVPASFTTWDLGRLADLLTVTLGVRVRQCQVSSSPAIF